MRPLIGQLSANQQETKKILGDHWMIIGSSLSEKSRKKERGPQTDRQTDRWAEILTMWMEKINNFLSNL